MVARFVGVFLGTLVLPVVWLIICRVIPPLRRRPGVSCGIGIALAFLPSSSAVLALMRRNWVPLDFLAALLLAFLLCSALLLWQYTRAKAKLLEAPSKSATPNA